MIDLEKYLKEINFTAPVDDIHDLNDFDYYAVHQIYVSPVIEQVVQLEYNFHYDEKGNRIVDFVKVEIHQNDRKGVQYSDTLFEGEHNKAMFILKSYFKAMKIDRKIALYRQWQSKCHSIEMIGQGVKQVFYGLNDWIKANLKIITIKLGGKIK